MHSTTDRACIALSFITGGLSSLVTCGMSTTTGGTIGTVITGGTVTTGGAVGAGGLAFSLGFSTGLLGSRNLQVALARLPLSSLRFLLIIGLATVLLTVVVAGVSATVPPLYLILRFSFNSLAALFKSASFTVRFLISFLFLDLLRSFLQAKMRFSACFSINLSSMLYCTLGAVGLSMVAARPPLTGLIEGSFQNAPYWM